jgi:parallel beta-helix repeat protein
LSSFLLPANIPGDSGFGTPLTRGRADIFWNATSTHLITEHYLVPIGTVLTIEAGATISFQGHYSIFVEGTLDALGTPADPILFTSGLDYTEPGDWGSVQFNSSSGSSSVISNAVFEYGQVGVTCMGASPSISDSTLTNNLFSGIYTSGSSSSIENNTISDNMGHGIHIVGSTLVLYGNLVTGNEADGVLVQSTSSASILYNDLVSNSNDGVHFEGGSDGVLEGNDISLNEHHGVLLDRASSVTLTTNDISNNSWLGLKSVSTDVVVQYNTIAENGKPGGDSGIGLESSDATIQWNQIVGNQGDGVSMDSSSGEISNNTISNNDAGIGLWRSSPRIFDNGRIGANQYGVYAEESSPIIERNVLMDNKYGIYSVNSQDLRVDGNIITNSYGKDLVVGNEDGNILKYSATGSQQYTALGSLRTVDQTKIDVDFMAVPSSVDLDDDGREDLIIGNQQGYFHYYRDTGDGYEDMGLLSNRTPLKELDVGSYSHPIAIDYDNDGDLDLFVGQGDGRVSYYTNDGNDVFWFEAYLSFAPGPNAMASPHLVHWLGGLSPIDLLLGGSDGSNVVYLGSNTTFFSWSGPLFVNLSQPIEVASNSSPVLTNWDADPDWDLIVGDGQGNLHHYETDNSGNPFQYNGSVLLESGSAMSVSKNAVPTIEDWNRDGYPDIVLGGDDGFIYYYENVGNSTFKPPQNFEAGAVNLSVGNWSAPCVVDWDGDGVYDLLAGDDNGTLSLFLGQETGNVSLLPGQGLLVRGFPTYISTGSWSAPAMVDWNEDGHPDLLGGGNDGKISYYENDGSDEFIFRWNLSSGGSEVDVGFRSAPRVVDWNSNGMLDILVGDLDGYIYRYEAIDGDLRNVTALGRVIADGAEIRVSQRATPCPGDIDEDFDLDLIVGDDTGRVRWFERENGLLFDRGNLKSDIQDLSVDSYSAPLVLGWGSSSNDFFTRYGMFLDNSTATITGNEVIRGGGGGYALLLVNSSVDIGDNELIMGGKGLYGGGTADKSSTGGYGILARDSSVYISTASVHAGDGSDSSRQKLEGGDGGTAIGVVNGSLTILNSSINGGAGRMGIVTGGVHGTGISITDVPGVFIDSSSIRGQTALMSSNSSSFLQNSVVIADEDGFDLADASSATSMNTSFDKTKVIFRDSASTLTVGWHLNVLVQDATSSPAPMTELRVWPATYTTERDVALSPSVIGPASPIVANFSSPSTDDLLIGDGNGNVQHFVWISGQFVYNGTLNKTGGVPVGVPGPCSPDLADWDGDGDQDLFLGDAGGSIWFFNNTGNGIFADGRTLNLTTSIPINISTPVIPRMVDWDMDSDLDIIAGGDGYIQFFQNNDSGEFYDGERIIADGSVIEHGSWSSPFVTDYDGDALLDLIVGRSDGTIVLYLNDTFGELKLGGILKANNSELDSLDAGENSTVAIKDLNGDGFGDLLIGNLAGEVEWFSSNRYVGDITAFTDAIGYAESIQVVEYEQRDSNGDSDGEDGGERLFLSPSMISSARCGIGGNTAPLPYLTESLTITLRVNVIVANCPPVVTATYPYQSQTQVPVTSPIILRFDKDMNKTLVEAALSFNPPLSVSPTWPSDREIILGVGSMEFSTDYTLTVLGSTAKDALSRGLDGNYNGSSEGSPVDDFQLVFRTEPIAQISSHGPDGIGMPLESLISVCFTKAMNQSSVEQFLSVSPSPSQWIWWDWGSKCIYIDAELEHGTTYTISISGDALDTNGNMLDGNGDGILQGGVADRYEWQFSTVADSIPPGVLNTSPINGQVNVALDTNIILNFTEPIDMGSLATGLEISSNGISWGKGTGPGTIPVQDLGTFNQNGSSLTISDLSFQPDATYQVTLFGNLTDGISDVKGNRLDGDGDGVSEGSPQDDYIFSFSTIDQTPPKVVFTYPAHEQDDIPLRPILRVIFDDDMDESSLNSGNVQLTLEGEARQVNITYSPSNRTMLVEPLLDLDFSETYVVNISSMVRDTGGNLLDGNGDGTGSGTSSDNYTWSFDTVPDNIAPEVTILNPMSSAIFEPGDIIRINGTATDSDRVELLEINIQFEGWIDITQFLNHSNGTWFYDWETDGEEDGNYPIQVKATDPSGLFSQVETIIGLRTPVAPFPVWIPILVTIIILIGATLSYRYFRSAYVEIERVTEQRRTEVEELLRQLEDEHEALADRAGEVEAKELDLDARESYLRDLDEHYESLAASLFARERIDLATGERIVEQEMGDNLYEIKRHEKAYILLSEAEASEAGEMTKKLPESGKKALLLVYFNALEAYLREKLKDLIPTGATILLGDKGHINTRARTWEEKWDTLSLGVLSHAIDHNKHFFVENEEEWEDTKDLMRETIEIRNLTAHPSEANPDVSDVRERVYGSIHSLSRILKRPRDLKK